MTSDATATSVAEERAALYRERVLDAAEREFARVGYADARMPDVAREAVWTEAELVGEVTAAGWTDSGHLRHPVWRGLRADKTVADVEPVVAP